MKKNIIIVGAGIAGELLREDIKNNHQDIQILGFIDDSKISNKSPLLGSIDDLSAVVGIYKVDEIVVALPSSDGNLMRKILLNLADNRIPIKLVPRTQEVINSDNVSYNKTKNFSCEDFLGRAFRKQETSQLHKVYNKKKVLITGGAGSIGSELVTQLLDLDVEQIVIYDNSELAVFNLDQKLCRTDINPKKYKFIIGSVTNIQKFDLIISEEQPDIIFHAAAYKHVYLMEDNIDEAIMNNVIGTKNIVDTAIKHNISQFVFISTDKVVNPTSVMGATKKLGEFYIKQFKNSKTKFNIVRFGNVINSNGSVLPLFESQLEEHKYLTVTHKDVKRFFMSIREAANLVISSLARDNDGGEIYILNMGELIKIYQIAVCLIRSKNLIANKDIEISITGLKNGEKIVEELFTETEMGNIEITDVDNVYRLKNHDNCYDDINNIIIELKELIIKNAPKKDLKVLLQKTFPCLQSC